MRHTRSLPLVARTFYFRHVVDFQNEYDLHGESLIAIGEGDASTDVNPTHDAQCLTQMTITEVQGDEASGDELHTRTAGLLPTEPQRTIGD